MDAAFETTARKRFDSEMDDVRKAVRLLRAADSLSWQRADHARDRANEYCGEPLSVETVKVVKVLLGTGGPACGYEIELDSDGQPVSGYYWYQDWFKEKRRFWLEDDQLDAVIRAYDIYIGE